MLRVGLTGDLGSGKSTVARMLAERGAVVLSSDEMGRALMQPGQPVFRQIVAAFGEEILADGTIDRRKLAAKAFDAAGPRVEELNAIVHPAVLEAQEREIDALAKADPHAIAVVESALIFSATLSSGAHWRTRFDCVVLVEAPEADKIARFVARVSGGDVLSVDTVAELEADARRRLAVQHATPYASDCIMLHNNGDIEQLEMRVAVVWQQLQRLGAGHCG